MRLIMLLQNLLFTYLFLRDLSYGLLQLTVLFCDNTISIKITNSSLQDFLTKHIELDWNYIEDKLNYDIIGVSYIKIADQPVGMMIHEVIGVPFHSSLSNFRK